MHSKRLRRTPQYGTIHDSLYNAFSFGLFAAYELESEDREPSRCKAGSAVHWWEKQENYSVTPRVTFRFPERLRNRRTGFRVAPIVSGFQEVSLEASRRLIHSSQASASEGGEGFQSRTTSKT